MAVRHLAGGSRPVLSLMMLVRVLFSGAGHASV
jgi:hypothetical protein